MCGICGKINLDNKPVAEPLLRKMALSLEHRGPDDEGVYINGNVGLGHRRLSIIDLSPAGHQPMSNEDGTVWIVYNGEIYNFRELREDLLKKGHYFRSGSDTETIIHLYEDHGVDCLKYLRGMFAFAIWDSKNETLFLARDRVGKKPLFYWHTPETFVFASEIKAMLQDKAFSPSPDPVAVHHYLTYMSVPSPFSAFKGVRKLPPAHYLLLKNGKAEIRKYWQLSYLPKFAALSRHDESELENELAARIQEAVRLRLVSDVPVGAFLSGGMDSSVIVSVMSGLMNEPVKTFSIGFEESDYDELRYAEMIAKQFGTDHTVFRVRPDALDVLPKIAWHYNEPFADPSAIPSYYVSELARQKVTVALNGDGGDEMFGGYERYVANELARKFERFPGILAKKILPYVAGVLPLTGNSTSFFWKFKRFAQALSLSPEMRNADWITHFKNDMKAGLYTAGFHEKVMRYDSYEIILNKYAESDADNFLEKTMYADVALYLADTLLVKMDIASMAHSLELRSPFLDHDLMEFVAKLPPRLKVSRGRTKIMLKNTFQKALPPAITARKKMGFGVPLEYWFRNELKDMAYDMLLSRKSLDRGYFNRDYVKKMLDEHVSGAWNWQFQIYNLLMLELWHRIYIDEAMH